LREEEEKKGERERGSRRRTRGGKFLYFPPSLEMLSKEKKVVCALLFIQSKLTVKKFPGNSFFKKSKSPSNTVRVKSAVVSI
jgi:hypothetical protein